MARLYVIIAAALLFYIRFLETLDFMWEARSLLNLNLCYSLFVWCSFALIKLF